MVKISYPQPPPVCLYNVDPNPPPPLDKPINPNQATQTTNLNPSSTSTSTSQRYPNPTNHGPHRQSTIETETQVGPSSRTRPRRYETAPAHGSSMNGWMDGWMNESIHKPRQAGRKASFQGDNLRTNHVEAMKCLSVC